MKYKVGDRVRIKKELKEGSFYDYIFVNEEMEKMAGKIVTIETTCEDKTYRIKENNHAWWQEKMFEEITKPTKKELFDMPIGTKIKVENDDDDDTFSVLIKIEDECFADIEECDQVIDEADVEDDLRINCWGYKRIIEVQEPTYSMVYVENEENKKEMTIAEIEEKLGYPIKIVKEKNK